MVRHSQTVPRLLPTNCLSVFDHFVGLTRKASISVIQRVTAISILFKLNRN